MSTMKIKTLIATLAVLLCVSYAQAQNQGNRRSRQRMDPTEMYNRNAERMAKQMKLDDEKTQLFTVLYLDYMNARQNAAYPKGEEQNEQQIDMKKLTEEQAKELIEKQFNRTEAQLKVDKEYYPKFLEFLTAVQTSQVFLRGMNMGGNRQGGNVNGPRGGGGFGGGFPGGGFPGGGDFGGGFGGGGGF